MPVQNWPPPAAPAWPPPGYSVLEFDRATLEDLSLKGWTRFLASYGFSQVTPTAPEQAAFDAARCDENHQLNGRILLHTTGGRYPFALCRNAQHRQLLVLWNAPGYTI